MKRILLVLSAIAVISACSKENNTEQQEQGGKFAFTAGFSDPSDPATKVFLEHNYYYKELYVLWEKGDQVTVNDGVNNAAFESDRTGFSTSLLASDGGTFNQQAPEFYSLFPHDPHAVFSVEGTLPYVTTTLPATQYARRDAFSSHIAVSSTTQSQKAFTYKNVTAVFKATITTEGVESLVFAGKNNENVAGKIRVNIETAEYSLVDSLSSTVTVLPPEGRDTFEPGRYYFTILPQTFATGFTVTINFGDGQPTEVRNVEKSNVEIRRSSLSIGKAIGTDGSGTQSEPYLIRNKYDFEGIATIVADDEISYETTTYIKIEEDINLSTIKSWTPINNSRDPQYIAKLDIDGNDKTISGFAPTDFADGIGTVDDGMDHNQPSLFGIIYGSVKDLTIENAALNTNTSTVGVLAGWVGFEGKAATVTNVHVSGVTSGKKAVGGISGMARNATFENCSAEVDVTATDENVGGFVARYYENCSFINCSSKGTVSAPNSRGVGGFLGFNQVVSGQPIVVQNCLSECDVVGNYQVGGLVGHTQSQMTIQDSWAKGDVAATFKKKSSSLSPGKQVGGILGVGANAAVTLTRCRYTGNISADGAYVGGIQGYNTGSTTISHCHAEGQTITNTGAYHIANSRVNYDMLGVGGILGGSNGTDVSVSYCFADFETISSRANGSLTEHPATWDAWVAAVKNESNSFQGGAVGGIIGYTSSETTVVYRNISWVQTISCSRTNEFDAPCAPIVGSISKDNQPTGGLTMEDNRYFVSSSASMTINDGCTNYTPRNDLIGQATNSVLNAVQKEGTQVNYYCLFCRVVKTADKPSETSVNWAWGGSWNTTGNKPSLAISPGPSAN